MRRSYLVSAKNYRCVFTSQMHIAVSVQFDTAKDPSRREAWTPAQQCVPHHLHTRSTGGQHEFNNIIKNPI